MLDPLDRTTKGTGGVVQLWASPDLLLEARLVEAGCA